MLARYVYISKANNSMLCMSSNFKMIQQEKKVKNRRVRNLKLEEKIVLHTKDGKQHLIIEITLMRQVKEIDRSGSLNKQLKESNL